MKVNVDSTSQCDCVVQSNSLKQTEKFAKQILKNLNKKIILFNGEMGSGKTTFILYFLKALGVKKTAGSPTFTIVNEYFAKGKRILHFDLYRVENANELINIDFAEQVENADIVLIEWPDIAKKYINLNDCASLTIKKLGENEREFIFRS